MRLKSMKQWPDKSSNGQKIQYLQTLEWRLDSKFGVAENFNSPAFLDWVSLEMVEIRNHRVRTTVKPSYLMLRVLVQLTGENN